MGGVFTGTGRDQDCTAGIYALAGMYVCIHMMCDFTLCMC